jgi:hypothetical protein
MNCVEAINIIVHSPNAKGEIVLGGSYFALLVQHKLFGITDCPLIPHRVISYYT